MSSLVDASPEIQGGTDGTIIGNLGDRLKVSTQTDILGNIAMGDAYSHNMIHTLANGEVFYHLIITPNTSVRIYFNYEVSSTGPLKIELLEGGTTSANGAAVDIYNRDRNSSETTTLSMYHTPTVTTAGNLIEAHSVGSTGGAKPGAAAIANTLILKQNTKYLIRYTSGASTNDVSEDYFWYEV